MRDKSLEWYCPVCGSRDFDWNPVGDHIMFQCKRCTGKWDSVHHHPQPPPIDCIGLRRWAPLKYWLNS